MMKPHESVLSSPANPAIKALRALEQKKYRDEQRLFVMQGLRYASQALIAGWIPQSVFTTPAVRHDKALLRLLRPHATQHHEVTPELMAKLCGRDNPGDVVATFHQQHAAPDQLQTGLWVALEEIRDPGNLGTIIRTAEAAGASGVCLIGNCCDAWAPEVIRASAGAITRVPVLPFDRNGFISQIRTYKGSLIGTRMDGAADFRTLPPEKAAIVLMGSEHAGLSDTLGRQCTKLVRIPMHGQIESLNVATATALVLYALAYPHGSAQ